MAPDKENYWSKHLTGIIQCVIGAYCAIFATWTYFHPRAIPTANQTVAPQTGVPMTSSYSMPLGLLIGIIALVLSVMIPAIIRLVKRIRASRATPESIRDDFREDLRKKIEQIEASAQLSRAQESLRRCEEEKKDYARRNLEYRAKLEAPPPWVGLFTPLQVETLQMAKNLSGLLKSYPLPKKTDYGYNRKLQAFDSADQIHAFGEARFKIEQKVRAKYAMDFQSKAVELYHRLVTEANIDDHNLEALVKGEAKTEEIDNLIIALRNVAFTLEDSQP